MHGISSPYNVLQGTRPLLEPPVSSILRFRRSGLRSSAPASSFCCVTGPGPTSQRTAQIPQEDAELTLATQVVSQPPSKLETPLVDRLKSIGKS